MSKHEIPASNRTEQGHMQVALATPGILLCSLLLLAVILYLVRYLTAAQTGVTGDDARYLVLAESFMRGQPYRVISLPDAPLETIWPPGYPLFVLAPAGLLFGLNYALLRATSVVLMLGNVLLTYVLVKAYLPNRVASLLVTAMFALNNWTAGLAGMVMSEPAFMFFLLLHLVLLQRWTAAGGQLKRNVYVLPVLGLTLAVAVFIRYQGVALVVASLLYLVWNRNFRQAMGLAALFLLLMLPFAAFLRLNAIDSPNSLFAVEMITGQITSLAQRLPETIWNYATAIPLVMLPALGPRVLDQFQSIGFGWLVHGFHLTLFALTAIGVVQGLLKRELPAIYVASYFALILLVDNQGSASRNEARYTAAMLPFLYLYLYQGLIATGRLFRFETQTLYRAVGLICSAVILVLLLRNVQQARTIFPVPDLSAGATWVQTQTAKDDVVMTHDPVERYLYLQRHTLPFMPEAYDALMRGEPSLTAADYLLIAPPLRNANQQANLTHELDPRDEMALLPAVQRDTQNFEMVWQDSDAKTFIFRILTPENRP